MRSYVVRVIEERSTHWPLLRLYADATPLGALVTPKKTPERAKRHLREARSELIEADSHVEVCHRSAFVGRRRSIQRCLRVLLGREGDEGHAEGVLLHGLGGLGKSSLAARLCDRMPEHRRVVCVGRLDEIRLLGALRERYPAASGLLNSDLPLKARLRSVLEEPLDQAPALFVFDDFEHNLDLANVGAGLRPEALDVLKALVQAIREVHSDSRVIVTSRFAFALESDPKRQPFLVHEALESMRGAELRKKLAQLEHLGDDSEWERERGAHEERMLEVHRLALAAPEKDIAVTICVAIAQEWIRVSRFREVVTICYATLLIDKNFRVLHLLANAEEVLGDVEFSRMHYEDALCGCPELGDDSTSELIKTPTTRGSSTAPTSPNPSHSNPD